MQAPYQRSILTEQTNVYPYRRMTVFMVSQDRKL